MSVSTIFRILKKIGYSHHGVHYRNPKQKENLPETLDFMEEISKLLPRQILATDESGYPLNLAPKKRWGPKGKKITRFKKHYSPNYTLILLIHNVENKGIIHWDLKEGAVDTEIFTNFVNNIKLSDNEKYYLLLDRLPVHKAKKVIEALNNKNIEPRLIVSANPWLNPTEEVFHVIKQYVEKQEPRTYEVLKATVAEKINELQKESLTKYFKDCLDFDFILKSGH
ncbi:transposase [endosymbiont GvMRE of Glomus versiforme]|uniref:transposase n=1 Tax=endosymbiont GvMRE of Glomus versiforme TaxID=2039283 RepID=UPI0011C42B02|nr:transposase [endosymbiont GvMRE of Glomus versiforme]